MRHRGLLRPLAVRSSNARKRRLAIEGLESRRLLAIVTTQFPINGASSSPQGITLGSNGDLWFTETEASAIGVFDPSTGTTVDIPTPSPASQPYSITTAPDGNIWFTELEGDKLGEVDPTTHAITEFSLNTFGPFGIAVDGAGNVWVTDGDGSTINVFDPTTRSTAFVFIPSGNSPGVLTLGPDGNIWFTDRNPGYLPGTPGNVGEVNPTTHAVQEFPLSFAPNGIATGPDGNLWFTNKLAGILGSINPTTHAIATYTLPYQSPMVGIAAGPGNDVSFGQGGMIGAFDTTTYAIAYAFPAGPVSPSGVATGPGGNPWFVSPSFGANGNTIGEVQAVPGVATTATISASPNPAYFAAGVVVTVAVTPAVRGPVDVGQVTLIENGLVAGIAPVVDGVATIHLPGQNLGVQSFVAEYSGGNAFSPSTSTVFNLPVVRTPTLTTLQTTANPGYVGLPITLTATVDPTVFTFPLQGGQVEFFDGATPIGTQTLTVDQVQLTYTPTTAGTHFFVAEYLGDQHYAPSASPATPTTVFAATATTTTLYPAANPTPLGKPLLLTASVTPAAGSGTPTGVVTFSFQDGTLIGTAPVGANGQAALVVPSAPFPSIGFNVLVASYSGDSSFAPSTSIPVPVYTGPPDGPLVSSLTAVGSRGNASSLVFAFDGPLHPATAQSTANYVIVAANGRQIPVKSAVYNETTDTVTVTPARALAARGIYIVTAIGVGPSGVTDVDGRLLDGTYVGQPGTNYSTVIVPGKLAVSGAVPQAPTVNLRAQCALLRMEMAEYRASLVASRHGR